MLFMESNSPRIEIFAPFGQAFELMQKILFRPFDPVKWLVIGFAAWLATFYTGARYNRSAPQDWAAQWRSDVEGPFANGIPTWFIPVLIVFVVASLAILLLVIWLNARARFIFTDCIVRNRGAIVEPWHEYRTEGNRYFVFQLVISLLSIVVFGGLGLLCFVGIYMGHDILPIAFLIPFGLICLLIAIVIAVLMKLAVPVMYRQRCDVLSALGQVWRLMVENAIPFILFVLFYLVLCLAAIVIGGIASCITCCVACIPYVGTVLLLPVIVVLYSYPLCFLRQFGDPYDVWAVRSPSASEPRPTPPVQAPLPSTAPPSPPPVQEPPTAPPPPPPPSPPAQ
jgi:hypothetical protein